MSHFAAKPIGEKYISVGDQLREARERHGWQLNELAADLKIRRRYLEALETNDYRLLPSGVYALNYLREYARHLNLPQEALLRQFAYERQRRDAGGKGLFERQVVRGHYFLVWPRVIKGWLIASVVLLCVIYIAWLIANIYLPPPINLFSPVDNMAVKESRLLISGQTEKESQITINGLVVAVDAEGRFEKTLDLRQGINKIVITAQKQNKRQRVVVREILYRKP